MNDTIIFFNARPPIERIRDEMKAQRRDKMTYSEIAELWGVSKGTAWRIVEHGIEPKDPSIRATLGLPEFVIVPVYRDRKGRFTKGG